MRPELLRARAALVGVMACAVTGCSAGAARPLPVEPARAPLASEPTAPTLDPVDPARVRLIAGALRPVSARRFGIDSPGVRGVFEGSDGRAAEIVFTYLGPSASTAPLASGELRRQIGLSLRAEDTCNLVYVMWHVEPGSSVAVSLKRNPGKRAHAACGAGGYTNVRRAAGIDPPPLRAGETRALRAVLRGRTLRAYADDVLAWEGELPIETLAIDGPAGLRTDNGAFVVEARAASSRLVSR